MSLSKLYKSYPKTIWILAVSTAISVTGGSMFFPLNTLYMIKELGSTIEIASVVLTIMQAFGLLGNFIGGSAFDRYGAKTTIRIGVFFSIIAVISMAFINDILLYSALLALAGLSNGFIMPSIYAIVGSIWPEGGRKAFNAVYVAQNLGVALGPIIGGTIFNIEPRAIFLINGVTFLIFYIILFSNFKKEEWKVVLGASTKPDLKLSEKEIKQNIKDSSYIYLITLAIAFMLLWIPYSQWSTTISVHFDNIGINPEKYTFLWTLNGLIIVIGQPLLSYVTKRFITGYKSQIYVGSFILVTGFLVLTMFNTVYIGFVIAMIIMTAAEMLVWPAVPAIAADLAPKHKVGFYQGVVSGAAAGGRMAGILLGGMLFNAIGLTNLMIIMLAIIILGIILFFNFYRIQKESI